MALGARGRAWTFIEENRKVKVDSRKCRFGWNKKKIMKIKTEKALVTKNSWDPVMEDFNFKM